VTRLTEETIGCFKYDLKNLKHKPGEFNDYDAFYAYQIAVKRLGELKMRMNQNLLISGEKITEIACGGVFRSKNHLTAERL
jgi:hypothetical protein